MCRRFQRQVPARLAHDTMVARLLWWHGVALVVAFFSRNSSGGMRIVESWAHVAVQPRLLLLSLSSYRVTYTAFQGR